MCVLFRWFGVYVFLCVGVGDCLFVCFAVVVFVVVGYGKFPLHFLTG